MEFLYIIETQRSAEDLVREVNKQIGRGYLPQGSMTIEQIKINVGGIMPRVETYYHQPMIRDDLHGVSR